jgi:hypothetical protein
VRVRGNRAYVSGHGALAADGSPLGPFGKVPSHVSLEDAQASARAAVLAILASLKRAVGELDRSAPTRATSCAAPESAVDVTYRRLGKA